MENTHTGTLERLPSVILQGSYFIYNGREPQTKPAVRVVCREAGTSSHQGRGFSPRSFYKGSQPLKSPVFSEGDTILENI